FLLVKSTLEIHEQLEGGKSHGGAGAATASFASIIVQIMLLDMVFSLDSVITAIGMTQNLGVMIAAIVGAVAGMIFFAGAISRFVEAHPTIKTLALSFLMLIGTALLVEGFGQHVPKPYIYFALAFSAAVELLNIRIRKRRAPPPATP
ncbi:MAG: TerC family protein, partial [Myxococcota bacterium]